MDTTIKVPIAWDAMRGEPINFHIPMPPTYVLLSGTMEARHTFITQPLQARMVTVAGNATRRSHDEDEARWHRNRPMVKSCPYDSACRFG